MARDLYCSPMFKMSRAIAELESDQWFILSAKHGVLEPCKMVANYNHTMKDKTAKEVAGWNALVARQLEAFKESEITVLAGGKYCGWIGSFKHINLPLKGLGMGYRCKWLSETLTNHNQKTLWEKNITK